MLKWNKEVGALSISNGYEISISFCMGLFVTAINLVVGVSPPYQILGGAIVEVRSFNNENVHHHPSRAIFGI